MLSNVVMYLVLKDSLMRARNWEKVLNKRRKTKERVVEKIEEAELAAKPYEIDWDKIAQQVREAEEMVKSGRQQS